MVKFTTVKNKVRHSENNKNFCYCFRLSVWKKKSVRGLLSEIYPFVHPWTIRP